MHNLIETRPSRMRPWAAAAAVLVALLSAVALVACNRPESQTAGERIDAATASAQKKATELKDDVKSAAGQVAGKAEQMTTDAANAVKDAAITTAVNAKIAQDPKLSVMRIDVDTVNGRVVLRGNATDPGASERARQLAASVEGVTSVDNQLVIGSKG
ncbi:MAG TPA: BON domain-containing protein [Burkholderiaceae bacterium]|nr:BON domain-containing protein [Burkholderiaceae bacterium]